ncbi:MAG: DNA mismatch repair endonuclease MutL, partial [Planctomycetota bacterium]
MGVINVLSGPVVNKIAAGEVIERPASVVKELVENALDAEASRVMIEVEDGGKKLIRVTDDGAGMPKEDLALAFSSHATSKLETDEDLFAVGTFGFRGEALTSIGAVSHARIVSRPRGSVEAGEVEMQGGQPGPVKAKGAPEGTTVEAANLFFNVPARRKFLRTAKTEFAHIIDHVSRIALAHPHVEFRLVHNGRETLALRPTDDRRRRMGDLYGRELADALLEVDSGAGPVAVTGLVAPPVHCRANRKMQLIYVNGRFVRDRRLSHAIAAAYEGLLVHGRFPVAALFVEADPRQVDVNVPPSKIEVRVSRGDL